MFSHEDFENLIEKKCWVTRYGKVMPIPAMSNDHLTNAIAYIQRGGRIYGYADRYLPLLLEEKKKRNRNYRILKFAKGDSNANSI